MEITRGDTGRSIRMAREKHSVRSQEYDISPLLFECFARSKNVILNELTINVKKAQTLVT